MRLSPQSFGISPLLSTNSANSLKLFQAFFTSCFKHLKGDTAALSCFILMRAFRLEAIVTGGTSGRRSLSHSNSTLSSLVCIGYSMFCVGYGIYTRERSSRVYIS